MDKYWNIIAALLVFTVIFRYDRPGSVYGESKWCVEAKSPKAAAAHARSIAAKELRPGYRAVSVTVVDDKCFWMPGDAPAKWDF